MTMRVRSPDSLKTDATIIAELLAEARALEADEPRVWTARWLLSPIHDSSWCLRKDGSVRVNGVWQHVETVDWEIQLADGTKLTDPCNRNYLEFVQRSAFLIREDFLNIQATSTHLIHISVLKSLTQWIFAQSRRFSPATHGFGKVDIAGIHDFMTKYTTGGVFEAGGFGPRFVKALDKSIYEQWKKLRPRVSIRQLPPALVQPIIKRLDELDFYRTTGGKGPNRGLKYVDRKKAAALIGADYVAMRIPGANAFLRQFEEDYKKKFPNLLVRVTPINHKHLSHRTTTLDYVNSHMGEHQVVHAITTITCLTKIEDELKFALNDFLGEGTRSPLLRYLNQASFNDRTPWMPLETSFAYLNEALRWVLHYGKPLVNFYLKAIKHFKENGLLQSAVWDQKTRAQKRDAWTSENIPNILKKLGISSWSSRTPHRIPMYHAMTILFGACCFLITGLMTFRIDELASLEKECLSFAKNDGFWIKKRRGKAVQDGMHHDYRVPIPRVTAETVGLLLRLGTESREFVSGYKVNNAKYLLYLPVFHSLETLPISLRDEKSVDYALDQFCDHVGLPTDEQGRRWYVRVHENRKAFLLTFVWYFKGASLEAARWLAGHTDPAHILAYLKANIPGVEISELEADYLAEALWDFGVSKNRKSEVTNISDLYRRVCTQFHVREISEVSGDELKAYLQLCLYDGNYRIDVINIITKTGKHEIALTVRMLKHKAQANA